MKSGRFHEIWWISPWNLVDFTREIWRISWNPWNPADFTLKSGRFHEIQWISWNLWNPVDFTHEIWQISPRYHLSNPPKIIKASVSDKNSSVLMNAGVGAMTKDFMKFTLKSGGFHPWNLADFTQISPVKSTQIIKASVSVKTSVWWMQGGGFHPRNPVDFTLKSGGFHPMKSGGFHPDFTCEIHPKFIKASVSAKTLQFDECRVGDFTLEIHQISPWNMVDFTCEIWQISPRFHLWNPPKIIKASVLAKTLQFDECRVGAMTKDFMKFTLKSGGFHPWNLVDFTHEIWWISPRYHLWNPPKIIKASVSAKTFQVDECRVGDFTLEIQWISPWNLVDFTCEIWQISPRFHLSNPPKIIKASVSAKTLEFDECKGGGISP